MISKPLTYMEVAGDARVVLKTNEILICPKNKTRLTSFTYK